MNYHARRFLAVWVLGAAVLLGAGSLFAEEFRLGGQTFSVPEGFEVELAAGPPLIERPISGGFDERGRLYASDSSGTNDKVDKQLAERPHRIVRLEDSDGDGRFDRSIVFADRMMFPEGILFHAGSVYCAAPPSIWKLTDTDDDGVADERVEWFQGKTLTNCANDLHGPYLGPDGWIYWAKGAFAKQTYERPGRPPFVTRAAHLFRARADGSGIEAVMTGGMDNPVDVVFTPGGERLFTTTFLQHPGGGKRDGLIHAVYGGVYGKVHDVVDEHPQTGGLLEPMTHLGPAVPCGFTRWASEAFGAEYRDNLFAALFNLHKVTRHALEEEGATFRTRDGDFLVSDSADFHPTDVIEDAGGSLLVIDTGGWYKICCPTSQLHKPEILGAIYRVRRKESPRPEDPRGLAIAWEKLRPEGLAGLLGDPRPAVRERAIGELARRGEPAIGALAAALHDAASAEARRNAVWALTRIEGESARAAARAALADRDPSVRQAAIHSAAAHRDAGALGRLIDLLAKGTPHNRRAAAEALGRIGDPGAAPAILAAASSGAERVLEHSLIYALIEIGDRESAAAGLASESPHARRAAWIAVDQMPGGGLDPKTIAPLLDSPDPALRDTARWIAGRHSDWGGALAGHFRARLAMTDLATAEARDLEGLLARFAKEAAVQDLLVAALAGGAESARAIALRAMARAGLKEAPAAWARGLASLIADSGADGDAKGGAALRPQAVAAARALAGAVKEGADELRQALLGAARDGAAAPELRLEALAALPGGPGEIDEDLFEFLLDQLDPERPLLERGAAADLLSRAKLGRERLLVLADAIEVASSLEIPRLLPAFEASPEEALGRRLVEALRNAAGLSGVRGDAIRAALAKFPEPVKQAGEEVIALVYEDAAGQRARLEELLGSLEDGDVRRGQALFNSPRTACSSCHAIGYLGGNTGPDLTRIGQVRSERDLLESIIYPSASFVRSYEPYLVRTRRGEIFTGILRKDAPDEVVLASGPTAEVRIPREQILEMRPATVSVMPEGMEQQLTPQELADLLAFLKATKW